MGRTDHAGPLAQAEHYLDTGVLDQAELLLDLVELFLLPADVGLQDTRPLLQLVFDGLEHAELCGELPGGVRKCNQMTELFPPRRQMLLLFCRAQPTFLPIPSPLFSSVPNE